MTKHLKFTKIVMKIFMHLSLLYYLLRYYLYNRVLTYIDKYIV